MGLCNQVDKLFTGREIKDAACNTLPFLFFVFTVHIPALLLQGCQPTLLHNSLRTPCESNCKSPSLLCVNALT